MKDLIIQLVLLISPSVITLCTMIGIIADVIKKFKELRKDTKSEVKKLYDTQDLTEIKQQLLEISRENLELKKALHETTTALTRIKRGEKDHGEGKNKKKI